MVRVPVPDSEGESLRDAIALTIAVLRDDREGQQAIVANCDLASVARTMAGITAGVVAAVVSPGGGIDPDQPGADLTEEQLQHAEALLLVGVQRESEGIL
jgi:hypothetical protein